MIKLDLTAILYSKKNLDLTYQLHKCCRKLNINLVTSMDFVDLTIKTMQLKPQLIFYDCETVDISAYNLETFLKNKDYQAIKIVFVDGGDMIESFSGMLANNISNIEKCDLEHYLCSQESDLKIKAFEERQERQYESGLQRFITNMLFKLGFSPKHTGYAYVRDIIRDVVSSDGIISSLTTEHYPLIAVKFKTTASNIERNIRNAISFAWDMYGKDNWDKMFFNFSSASDKRPTNREFICMCVDKITSDYNEQSAQGFF